LKRHPFFKGIDFDKIFLIKSPITFKNYKRVTIMQKLIDEGNFGPPDRREQMSSIGGEENKKGGENQNSIEDL
jgi:hypothetical protein